jgi:hypothetical protein
MKKYLFLVALILFSCFLISGISLAQEQYGNIRGKVTDSNKEPLPGVSVSLECPLYGTRSIMSSPGGTFRFLNLPSGTYSLKCELSGFKTHVEENIIIRVGKNFDFPVVLEQATLKEDVTVVATSPIVDTKKTGTAFNVTEVMLQDIPSARDPWAILNQAPGIFIFGENVGGINSADQSHWTSKGTLSNYFGNYNMDGVDITNMSAIGLSSRNYDFDSFEEIQIVTTGQDPSVRTGGVSINLITRRGSNKYEFLGRFFFTNDKLQGDNRTQELIDLDYMGNQINQLVDYGFQAGGPILRDKLWFWLGYGVQDIRLFTLQGFPDDSKVESFNAKLNFQISRKDRGELAFISNDKSVLYRGIGPNRPPEATSRLIGNGSPLVKLEYERMFSDNFLMTVKLAHCWQWWGFDPNGGMDTQAGFDIMTRESFGTSEYYRAHRPSYSAQIDGNFFLEAFFGGDHEIKFGVEYRQTPDYGEHVWPGGVVRFYWNGQPLEAMVYRSLFDRTSDRLSFYFNDSFSRGRLTFNLGVRVDRENFWNDEIEVPASPIAPEAMPAFTMPRIDVGVILWTISPRLGMTYDLTGDGKTIVKANLARYGMWPDNLASIMSVTEGNELYFNWNDKNGDDLVSTDELVGYPDGFTFYSGFNPFDPTNPVSPYEIAKDLPTGYTDELLIGLERELFTDFALSANFTWRRVHNWNWWVRFNRETGQKDNRADWGDPIPGSITVDGKTYNYEYWAPETHRNELPNEIFESFPNWSFNYTGFEIIATKRLSHRWMMNASLTLQQSFQHYGEGSYFDPTNIAMYDGAPPFHDSRWMAKLNFLYQLPWGFNFSGFAKAREGTPYWQQVIVQTPQREVKGLGKTTVIYVEKLGETRYPTFTNVDLSLSKDFLLGRYGRVTVQVDAFNVFNFSHTLARDDRLNSPWYGEIWGILNPRVIRLGVRYRF